jgi:hypothetical protein
MSAAEAVKVRMANISPAPRAEGQDVLDSAFDLMLMTEDGVDVKFTLDVASVTILSMTLQSVLRATLNEAKAAHPDKFQRPSPFDFGGTEG